MSQALHRTAVVSRFWRKTTLRSLSSNPYMHTHSQVNSMNAIYTFKPISLTENEKHLFEHLKAFISEKSLHTTVRVAGGWVRDKILGVPGKNDVDLALDNMTGLQFVHKLNTWNEEHGREKRRFGVIQQNPDKSKHLETVSFQFEDIGVDLVNLRTESYCNSSRVPLNVSIGTPREDAFRRDLTINSLYYNIHTECIEDHTQRGLMDLQEGRIRTPLPALITLEDDPLRALRAIRFACRFEFEIDDDLFHAASSPSVHKHLLQKVSRERINIELELMAKTTQFGRAMAVLRETRLWQSLVHLPSTLFLHKGNVTEQTDKKAKERPPVGVRQLVVKNDIFEEMDAHNESTLRLMRDFHDESVLFVLLSEMTREMARESPKPYEWIETLLSNDSNRRLFMFGAMMSPCRNMFTIPSEGKLPIQSIAGTLLQNALKMSSKDFRIMDSLQLKALSFSRFLSLANSAVSDSLSHSGEDFQTLTDMKELEKSRCGGRRVGAVSRLDLGMEIRDAGERFPIILLIAALRDTVDALYPALRTERLGHAPQGSLFSSVVDELATKWIGSRPLSPSARVVDLKAQLELSLRRADHLMNVIKDLELEQCFQVKPLFDGHELRDMFPKLPEGYMVGHLLELQKKWLLCEPHNSKEDLQQFLFSRYSRYR